MFIIPFTTFSLILFLVVMVLWGMMSWANSPAVQSYLIESSPETAGIQQSFNNSSLHLGIAFGSFLGGRIIEQTSVQYNATVGGILVMFALLAFFISMYRPKLKFNS